MNDLPNRRNLRLHGYDYSQNGAYFITICTKNRLNLFGDIVGDGFPVPITKLNYNGEIIKQFIGDISIKYEYVTISNYVIMPNHIHMLLLISNPGTGNPSPTVGAIMGWLKYQTTKHINLSNDTVGEQIWQRSHYDHIIRNEAEYQKIWKYIDENPIQWQEDCYYQ